MYVLENIYFKNKDHNTIKTTTKEKNNLHGKISHF